MYLTIFALPSASAILCRLPLLTSLSNSSPRGITHAEEGNYLLMRGWDFCAKTQFLGVFNHIFASVGFHQLPPASVDYSLVDSPSTRNHPCGGGELFIEAWAVFLRENEISWRI